MSQLIYQKLIVAGDQADWRVLFSLDEYLYLKGVVNGLISNSGGFDEVAIQVDGSARTLHIYEPFTTLNYLGYGSPSVVSIQFNSKGEIYFLSGDDNGIGINSSRLVASKPVGFPNNLTTEICLWHFIDAIGSAYSDQN